MTDTTPDHLAQDDAEATRIAREIREGLLGVTPGEWFISGRDLTNVHTKLDGSSIASISAFRDEEVVIENAEHIARCSPDRLDILIRAFEARAKEIAELRAALEPFAKAESPLNGGK